MTLDPKLTPFQWKLAGVGAAVLLLLWLYPKNYKGGNLVEWVKSLFNKDQTSPTTTPQAAGADPNLPDVGVSISGPAGGETITDSGPQSVQGAFQ